MYIVSLSYPGVTWIRITDTGKPPAISDSERKTGEENCLPSAGGAGSEPLRPAVCLLVPPSSHPALQVPHAVFSPLQPGWALPRQRDVCLDVLGEGRPGGRLDWVRVVGL